MVAAIGKRPLVSMEGRGLLARSLIGVVLSVLVFASPRLAQAIEVEMKSIEQTVREADAIFVGSLVKQESRYGDEAKRFIYTDHIFKVEDVVLSGDRITKEKEVRLTIRGGKIDGKSEEIAGMPRLSVGDRCILLLRPGWTEIKGIPLVGAHQGLFRVVDDPKTKTPRVFESTGAPIRLQKDAGVVRLANAGPTPALEEAVTLEGFVELLKKETPRIKKEAAPKSAEVDPRDPRILKTFARPHDPKAAILKDKPQTRAPTAPMPQKAPKALEKALLQPVGAGKALSLRKAADDPPRFSPRFATSGVADLPILINQFPATMTPWSPEDQAQMLNWNHYASDVFQVFVTPPDTWAWGNGVFDLAGWPSSDDMKAQFGQTWAELDNPWAIAFVRKDGSGKIVEADVALNPAQSWTLDDEAVYNGSAGLRSFRRTMTHELGHVWGLEHQFDFLSVMNYPPDAYRPFPLPFMDDAEAIRQNYPARKVETTDLGIHLFYSAGNKDWRQADFPATVRVGTSFNVTNYHLENVGTRAVDTPTVEWYLTPARNFDGAFYLGSTTYPKLDPFNYFDPPSAARTLTVPAGVPTGTYFLAAFIRGDESRNTSGFQGNNSRSFSRTKIGVNP